MRMTALVSGVADHRGGGYIAWVRGYATPIHAKTERDIEVAMRNRLINDGQQFLESLSRVDEFDRLFHPWKPGDDGE